MAYKIRPQVLDKIRALHGFTSDQQLADFMGMSLSTISNIRRGGEPKFSTAIRLLDAAEISTIRAGVQHEQTPVAA